jgi:hypothetical protein
MKTTFRIVTIIIVLLIFPVIIINMLQRRTSSAVIMQDLIGSDSNGFWFYSYPTGNYGVATAYELKWGPGGMLLCDMLNTYHVHSITENSEAWKTLNEYAFYGEGGSLTLEDQLSNKYESGILLRKILQPLHINVGVVEDMTKNVHLHIGSLLFRSLNYGKFKTYALSGKNKALSEAWRNKNVLIATADIVLMSYSLEINPQDAYGVTLKADLDKEIASPQHQVRRDSLGIKIERSGNGRFIISSDQPVVLAVYVCKQRKVIMSGDKGILNELEHVSHEELRGMD